MLAEDLFKLHSADRTDAGEQWARAVGGEMAERDQRGTPESAERKGAAGLKRPNQVDWPPDVVHAIAAPAST
jgi:hypothetical protein